MTTSALRHSHRTKILIGLLVAALLFLLLPRAASASRLLEIDDSENLEELDRTVDAVTRQTLTKSETPSSALAPEPAPRSTERVIDALPPQLKRGSWTIGIGPFIGHKLGTEKAMYDFAIGYNWNVNPRAAMKIFGESNFSSSAENARFLNAAVGANFFGSTGALAPYLTTDIGYGFARNAETRTAEGFSAGLGAGLQFFKTTETSLDLLLRYAVILADFGDGTANPSVTGLRLSVNF